MPPRPHVPGADHVRMGAFLTGCLTIFCPVPVMFNLSSVLCPLPAFLFWLMAVKLNQEV